MTYYKIKFNWENYEVVSLLTKDNKIAFIGLDKPYYKGLNEFIDIVEIEDDSKNNIVLDKLNLFKEKKFVFNASDYYLDYLSDNTKGIYYQLANVSYETYLTYKQFAKLAGNEKAVRSIATKIGKNPIALLIPCHRIVSSNSSVKYRYGSDIKKYLIDKGL
ncbi:MGMT family protein [Spiroplasma endosymbiont of Othius punctulatus]|uniref:MGMT family protein n=1 Tax=Spiroplasma endosymbiont of Othius punctulatus TaxID=3066289 RepID=UPI0030D11582